MKKIMYGKRFVALLTGMVLTFLSLPLYTGSAKEESTVRQVNNIVLFAQFDSLEDKNFMESSTDTVQTMCNDDTTYRSLSKYVDTISYGQMQVTSYFPQLEDDVIIPYVLQQERSSYTDSTQYAMEMLQNISIPKDIPLDGNQDGYIDNIVCVVDGKTETFGDPLWSKAFYLTGLEINGCLVGSVNLHSGYTLIGSTLFNGIGTLCHEFLHSMGYPDLYRRDQESGNPVGLWDIMASPSIFLQYPLAYQRYAVSGWMDAGTITQDGTYTLYPASASSGNRLYLLKTPLSDTEFFAVEYRKPGTRYSDELDAKVYGEGLVVYRVNTAVSGNYKGNTDGIYVFRPDETTLNGGAGDLTRSYYGGTGAPESIGTTDLQKTFADGALVYEDGTNSGIALDNIQIQENGTLTFSATFADVSEKQLWQTAEHLTLPSDLHAYDLIADENGTLYFIAASDTTATLYQMEEDQIKAISTPFSGSMNNPKLVICNGIPYVLYQDEQYLLRLCKWNNDTSAWETCYTSSELSQYQDITTDGERIYFTSTTGTYPYVLQADCYDPKTEQVTSLGTNLSSNACNMEIAAINGKIIIGYRDLTANSIPKIAVFDGENWSDTALSDQSCGAVSVLADEDGVWIAPSGGKNPIYFWEDGTIISYPLSESLVDRAFQIIPVLSNGTFYIAVDAQNPEVFELYQLQKQTKTWELTGNSIAQELVNQSVLAAKNEKLYCLYTSSDQKVFLKTLQLSHATDIIVGDLNENGTLDLADVVLLQQHLLQQTTLTAEQLQRADGIADQFVNGMDLAWLKRKLLG
ncbi:m6 family metalloprotease domain protein [Ruminococcus sp. CAG:403]|nr:m6 family metalloprotease domain protein [Ruminococcus sp. CAG:403]